MERRPSIAVIGSGNVATHLSLALASVADIVQICSRHIGHAAALAKRIDGCIPIDDLSSITPVADYYLISVNDDAIPDIADSLADVDGIVMHTSGSVCIDALMSRRRGVFYPLQTFSKDASVDISEVPFFIEGSDEQTARSISDLASSISTHVYRADSAQRTVLHIAAVFGCNFFNHLLSISSDILGSHGYSLDVLRPLLQVTLDKAMTLGPHKAQTGPAVRHDTGIIAKHSSALSAGNAEIYRLLSQSIMDAYPK